MIISKLEIIEAIDKITHLTYNLDDFKNKKNPLIIIGPAGSGNSIIARELSDKYSATLIAENEFKKVFDDVEPTEKIQLSKNELNLLLQGKIDSTVKIKEEIGKYTVGSTYNIESYDGNKLTSIKLLVNKVDTGQLQDWMGIAEIDEKPIDIIDEKPIDEKEELPIGKGTKVIPVESKEIISREVSDVMKAVIADTIKESEVTVEEDSDLIAFEEVQFNLEKTIQYNLNKYKYFVYEGVLVPLFFSDNPDSFTSTIDPNNFSFIILSNDILKLTYDSSNTKEENITGFIKYLDSLELDKKELNYSEIVS